MRRLVGAAASSAAAALAGRTPEAERVAAMATVKADEGLALAKSGEVRKAVTAFEAALKLDPSNLKARYNLGLAYLAAGGPVEAEAAFRAFLTARPDDAEARYNLARALAVQRRNDEALRELQAAVNAGFSNHAALQSAGGFEALHQGGRYIAIEALVAQRAGVVQLQPGAGVLGKGAADAAQGYGGVPVPGLMLPGQKKNCTPRPDGTLACEEPPAPPGG